MHWLPRLSKYVRVMGLFCLFTHFCRADTVSIRSSGIPAEGISLASHFSAWEDPGGSVGPTMVMQRMGTFVQLKDLRRERPTDVYWLVVTLDWEKEDNRPKVITFGNLTFVDLYLFQEDRCL